MYRFVNNDITEKTLQVLSC